MNKFVKYLLPLLLLTLLAGCATLPKLPRPSTEYTITKAERYQQLSQIISWTIRGGIAIRYAEQSNIASLIWQQQLNIYNISLFGPFNLGAVRISNITGIVALTRANGKTYSALTPETLMQQQLGWQVPISNLYYWVRGIANPNTSAQVKYDSANRAIEINQQGWTIQYLEFVSVKGVDLPQKIIMTSNNLQVRMVIKQWQF